MPELTPRRGIPSIPPPNPAEIRAANELLDNLRQIAPESLEVTDPLDSLPELARALEARTKGK